ncbi:MULTISPECIES: LON peptidase substrate-binding domain-containing protein [unclassified Micromonospora]|uniref:LON peptidase substrate-binding domain-containing protein n=1 Tax=unclassified Micromonospora TaxID=2617518 RepID=UPI00188F54EB|nr:MULTISPECIES: LON peptidase substrate-binding domain-containing protein [unclassified Micromonospora]MBF5031327.1 LON peptidase substrate-binding domain-containing protein [Micromonospora sp. ANENR4]MCZ7476590.1 LON peptidase substrate-binding domain-containing protein [Micromonospora sp. WMMC273]WBC01416.1 LON peptidase substrate-binding domain-containing protein [Micromonospora sp. WMMA1976]
MSARLPVFPLGTVLFPGLVLPLHIFEERYKALVRHLVGLPEGVPREFGVVAIQAGWEVAPAGPPGRSGPAGGDVTLHEVGCTAELRQVTELADGGFDIVTVGRRRFRVAEVDASATPYLTAEVEWLPEPDGPDEVSDLLAARVISVFRQYLGLIRPDQQEITEQLPEDPTVLSHLVAATAALTVADRQRLLAADDTAGRLRAELRLLNRETALLRQVRAVPVPLSELAGPPAPN